MTDKHTPGPWNLCDDGDGGFVFDRDMEKIADTYYFPNARLIAAAPDMLAALHEAREFIDGQIDVVDGSYGVPAPNRAMSLAQEIDAAIAKATGAAS